MDQRELVRSRDPFGAVVPKAGERSPLECRDDFPGDFAEVDAVAFALAPAAHRDAVAVMPEGAVFAGRQGGSAPRSVSSRRQPREPGAGPPMVPEARRSPPGQVAAS